MTKRCVVTGQDAHGKAVVVHDEMIEPVSPRPGITNYPIWGDDNAPTVPNDGSRPNTPFVFPPPGGYRFIITVIAPETEHLTPEGNDPARLANVRAAMGTEGVYDPDNPLMHTTDTVDVDYLVSGELWLELDDGEEVHLRAGDCVIQNGTRHAWHNRTSTPAVMLAACIGAERTRA